jgi:dTDP-glucose 4,6-dehydratase
VQSLLEIFGKPTDWIEFITDRPGHDLRYAIDASATTAELGWEPKQGNFEQRLSEVVRFYVGK